MLILTAAEFGNSAERTMDGEMQDTHKCKERAKMAADIIAEKYGWMKAESDRRTAIWLALNAIKRFVKSPFRTEFFAEQSDQRSSVARLKGRTFCQKVSLQKLLIWESTKVLRSARKTLSDC